MPYGVVLLTLAMHISAVTGSPSIIFSQVDGGYGACGKGILGTEVDCSGGTSSHIPPPPPPPHIDNEAPPPHPASKPPPHATAPRTEIPTERVVPLLRKDGGSFCVGTGPISEAQGAGIAPQLAGAFPPCPTTPAGAAPAPVATPRDVAVHFVDTIPLPRPKPTIPPGFAITGKPAYLVTNGTVAPKPFETTTALGPLSVAETGSYTVHWGDGATSGPYDSEGQPYPNGKITHTYDDVGTVTVTVDESWVATWSLAGASGTITQLQTQASIPGFTIRQIQAVITS